MKVLLCFNLYPVKSLNKVEYFVSRICLIELKLMSDGMFSGINSFWWVGGLSNVSLRSASCNEV
jgi:hypothetical protein